MNEEESLSGQISYALSTCCKSKEKWFHDQSHHRRKIEYQNLSPYLAAPRPKPNMTTKAPNARMDRLGGDSGSAELTRSRHTNIPASAPHAKRTQNSRRSVFWSFSVSVRIVGPADCALRLVACC